MRCRATASALTAVVAAITLAPVAAAAPRCVNLNPTTTQCQNPGHSAITTSPPAMNDAPWWPYGGHVVGFPW